MEHPQVVPSVVNPNYQNPVPQREQVQAAGQQPRKPPLAQGAAQAEFRPQQGANQQYPAPAPQVPPGFDLKVVLQQIIDGQSKTQQEINKKVMELKQHVDGGYTDLQKKFETLNSQFKSLDNRIAQVASSSQRTPGTLPGTCEANPKETCNVTFCEDDSCEESMERSLREEDSDDDIDTCEILSAERNEKVALKILF
ncbi:unnamed protein product [Arabis nemorensis]|uniref:Uncharacterized protein n=1 Tax=Arabis nemorensis TaxID=586526 RepID=A0A565AXH8_9BRAS|nr:unnamed protein product [Arabis nemorensis]